MPSQLVDRFGRVADDLRVSVTDRCNFRCVYCMPAEGLPWLPKEEILSFEETSRLVGLLVRLGVRTVRFTGGEPLVRRDLPRLVAMIRSLGSHLDLALTTNGVLLSRHAEELASAGLDRVNVSLDSLRRDRFEAITRRDALDQVMDGLQAARVAGLDPIKINVVVMRGRNDDEVVDLARWAAETGFEVRFIEFMPLDAENEWSRQNVIAAREMLEAIESEMGPVEAFGGPSPEPATRFRLSGGGTIGIIPSVTQPFCSTCNRLRITAEGGLRTCLFAHEELDLKALIRSGAPDDQIEQRVMDWVWGKEAGHRINEPDFVRPTKSMSQIGG